MAVTLLRGPGVSRVPSLSNGNRLWEVGDASGLPRNGLVLLADPYRDAYGLAEAPRLALQTGVDYSGRGNTLTYGATTGASTDDPVNTGTAWSFDGGDFLRKSSPTGMTTATGIFGLFVVKKTNTGATQTLAYLEGVSQRVYSDTDNASVRIRNRTSNGTTYENLTLGTITGRAEDWNVIGVGFDAARDLIYGAVNGTLSSITHTNGTYSEALSALTIGFNSTYGYLTGQIALGAIWNWLPTAGSYARTYLNIKGLMVQRGIALP